MRYRSMYSSFSFLHKKISKIKKKIVLNAREEMKLRRQSEFDQGFGKGKGKGKP